MAEELSMSETLREILRLLRRMACQCHERGSSTAVRTIPAGFPDFPFPTEASWDCPVHGYVRCDLTRHIFTDAQGNRITELDPAPVA